MSLFDLAFLSASRHIQSPTLSACVVVGFRGKASAIVVATHVVFVLDAILLGIGVEYVAYMKRSAYVGRLVPLAQAWFPEPSNIIASDSGPSSF